MRVIRLGRAPPAHLRHRGSSEPGSARRQVGHRDRQPGLVGEALQLALPQPDPYAVAAAAVGGDQQPCGGGSGWGGGLLTVSSKPDQGRKVVGGFRRGGGGGQTPSNAGGPNRGPTPG